ncbi:hypothetical protein NDU88_008207 [Pleurodeles waltl]|uniref:Uncharacterized protein n=1 Tax=Pleurodeles waltl TaxID=8319 RepID=A0AAV7N5P9_PLEWA|nr:hypothetical protein NDU88_008207 [Pleurodeles waltl]
MAAAAPGSEPLRGSPSARPLDHARSANERRAVPAADPAAGLRQRRPRSAPQLFTRRAREERLIKRPSRSPSWLLILPSIHVYRS